LETGIRYLQGENFFTATGSPKTNSFKIAFDHNHHNNQRSIVFSPSFLLKEKKQKFKAAQLFPKKNSISRKETNSTHRQTY